MRTVLGTIVCSNLMCSETWKPFTRDGYLKRRPSEGDYWLCDSCLELTRRARRLHDADDLPTEPQPRTAA